MTGNLPPGVPAPGSVAPDFELVADDGKPVALSDFRGRKVVLYFYPKAMTSGCTVQAQHFRDARADLEARGAVVLGVSPDSVADLAKFRAKEGLNFPLLSDQDHAVAAQFGVWGEKKMYGRQYEGILRSQFVIGEDGTIIAADYKVSPAKSLAAALEALV